MPLLYATICVNLFGFHLASGQTSWATVLAVPVLCIMVYRLFKWRGVNAEALEPAEVDRHLQGNLRFTRILCLIFLAWSLSLLVEGARDQQQYVVVFAGLAALGCAVALACAPVAAKQPLLLLALPIAAWSIASGDLADAVIGVSIAILVVLVRRMIVVQDEGMVALLEANASLAEERARSQANEERYAYASQATNDLIWDWDVTTDTVVWNGAIRTHLGYPEDEIGGSMSWWRANVHPGDVERVLKHLDEVMASRFEKFEDEYRFRKSDGSYAYIFDRGYIIRDERGAARRMVGAMQDLSDRKDAEEKLLLAATRDPLTKLPNRTIFRQRLAAAVEAAVLRNLPSSVLLLDLDEFKQINDLLGHDAGDALLKGLAERLTEILPNSYEVARLGGDEFGIVIPEMEADDEVAACAAAILQQLREPFVHEGRILDCGATIGAARIPKDGRTPEEVIKSADIALYAAKARNRGGYTLYQPHLGAELQQRLSMLQLAKTAVREDRIMPYYQPKVNLADGAVIGFEALLRWRHTSQGTQQPDTIAAAFEDIELAAAISDKMIEQVLVDCRNWLDGAVPFGHVAINAAAAEFRQADFAERLLHRACEAGVPISLIHVEVTETVFMGRGADHVAPALTMLSNAGATISLDDFGTGYASLRHLKEFPVDEVKIDRSFVDDMCVDAGDEAIVRGIISLANSLGLKVVAEGVETRAQADRLIEFGCDFGQGFLFSKAVPAERVPAVLALAQMALLPTSQTPSSLRLVAAKE
jgi:diguanylate cyclase (GGDEF)-like protein/PAS domain S-box-containing protein